MKDHIFAIYILMQSQGVYHLLNQYKKRDKALEHYEKMVSRNQDVKILEIEEAPHNIEIEKFNKMWNEQQPVAVS
jgi:hypothetical protein